MREEIHDAHERSTSDADRALCLGMFFAVMDQVEREMVHKTTSEEFNNFREARRKDYSLFIVRECLIGENVSPDLLDFVTKREMAAGRMKPDHPLRQAAEQGMAEPHLSPAEMLEQHQAKLRGSPVLQQEIEPAPPIGGIAHGFQRVARAIRWLCYGLGALLALGGVGGLVTASANSTDKWSVLFGMAGAGAVIAGIGWTLAWIIEGFAGRAR